MNKQELEKQLARLENEYERMLDRNTAAKCAIRVLAREADNPVQKMCYLYLLAVLRGDAGW